MKDDSLVEMDENTSLSIASQLATLFEEASNLDDEDTEEESVDESFVPRVSLENHGVADSSQKPDITHLEDAIVGGTLLIKVGEKLVLERCASLVDKRYWLDTAVYKILTMDDDGTMRLLCMETGRRVFDNWKEGPSKYSYVYKIPPKKGSFYKQRTKKLKAAPTMGAQKVVPTPVVEETVSSEKKQGRRKGVPNRPKHVRVAEQKAKAEERLARKKASQDKKNARNVAKAAAKVPTVKAETRSAGGGRGRPKGTKNRSKEERAIAKAQLLAQRQAKKLIEIRNEHRKMEKFVPVERREIVPGDCCKFLGIASEADGRDVGENREWRVNTYNAGPYGRFMLVGWDEIFIAIPYPEDGNSYSSRIVQGQFFLHSSGRIFIVYDFPLEKLCTV